MKKMLLIVIDLKMDCSQLFLMPVDDRDFKTFSEWDQGSVGDKYYKTPPAIIYATCKPYPGVKGDMGTDGVPPEWLGRFLPYKISGGDPIECDGIVRFFIT